MGRMLGGKTGVTGRSLGPEKGRGFGLRVV